MDQNNSKTVIIVQKKSMAVALLLTFFLGPLGLLYVSVIGAIVLIILSVILGMFTFGVGALLGWVAAMIWAAVAVSSHNQRLLNQANEIN